MYNDCRDCENYEGDCGNHFVDGDGHIIYTIAREVFYDGVLGSHASCFKASSEYLNELKNDRIKEIAGNYSMGEIEDALKLLRNKEDQHGK